MDISMRLLTIKKLDYIRDPKHEDMVKRFGFKDVSYYRENKKK